MHPNVRRTRALPRPGTLVLLVAALTVGGCKKEAPPAPAAPTAAAPAAPAAPAPAAEPAPQQPGAVMGTSNPDCLAPFNPLGEPEKVKLGTRTFERRGTQLTVTDPDADDRVVFGVIANLKEPTGENLFNLRRYVDFFKAEKAEALLVPGDTGESADDIVQVLKPLAATGLPLLVIPGNRESRTEFHAAVDALARKFPNVVDMTRIRLVNFDDASIVSLPGYYDRRFIHAGDEGCQYFVSDLEQLKPALAAAKPPTVLLAHAEPLGRGHDAIDAFQDGNAGDKALRDFLAMHPVPFGVFANIQEAGGRATDLDSTALPPDVLRPRLFLNTGLADSTPWKLNDGTWAYGMVTALTIQGQTASYKVFRAGQLGEKEQAEATRLQAGAK